MNSISRLKKCLFFSSAFFLMGMVTGCSTSLKKPTTFDYEKYPLNIEKNDFNLYVADSDSEYNIQDENLLTDSQGDGAIDEGEVAEDLDVSLQELLSSDDDRPILFIVSRPEWNAVTEIDDKGEEDVLFTLRERMYRYLLRNYPHPARVRYAWIPNEKLLNTYRVIRIDSEVTHATKGSGSLRFLIGYGAGAVTLQYEGLLSEIHPDEEFVGAFALRQRHAAYPNGFFNTMVTNDAYCMRYAAESIVNELTLELPNSVNSGGVMEESND